MPLDSLVRFYRELRRRKVLRVATAYAIVAWLLVEVVSVVFPQLLLPDWSVRLFTVFAIVGFPIALVLAWAVDIRPDRGPDEPAAAPGKTEGAPALPAEPRAASEIRSIAVLPLLNLSHDPENEYFSDGMAEEVLNRLCRLPQLTVASRTSSFSFKGKDVDLKTVAEKLGVDAILEGSVRRAGDRVRITAQLIDGHSDRHLWSETYERDLSDVFSVQDEIAQNIVQTLEISLTPIQQRSIRTRYATDDVGAYDFYLRGRHYFYRGDVDSALEMFDRSVGRDPAYAPAWAGAADVHAWACLWGEKTPEHLDAADECSRQALRLAPDLAEAHAARGFALVVNGKYPEAEAEFASAIELDPQLYEVFYYAGRACFVQGKFREAVEMFGRAGSLRPDDVAAASMRLAALSSCGTAEEIRTAASEVVEATERHMDLHPDDALALSRGANALLYVGDAERALAWAERAYTINHRVCGYNVACVFARAGQAERALEVLEQNVGRINMDRAWLEKDRDWEAVRDQPRFRAILDALD